ncbi:hypothetical protein UFOVP190_383 [uncultured Caudovirales phage]|uniref:Uncharacterized protein n=1 Tax=uncultured Caudovirales phage TaxID=2100421 RepID=A0A6J7WPP4_9CAUD|nr:hypothetical protein UFOVP190_383 [uncultured Caudovirales phage]
MKKQYNTLDALAASIVAFETNTCGVVRDAVYENQEIKFQPNRVLITNHLEGTKLLPVTDEHRTAAEDLVTYLQQTIMMQTLMKGSSDSFAQNVLDIISEPTMLAKNVGLLAWAPKLSADLQKKDSVRQASAHYERSSRYVGSIGSKIIVDFTLIESRFVPRMDCYSVYGHTAEGNLIFYWSKKAEKIVQQGRIEGRVKKQVEDGFRNKALVTTLNYVKVL